MKTLISYKTIWFRGRDGESDYYYRLTWSDGSTTEQHYWSADLEGVLQS